MFSCLVVVLLSGSAAPIQSTAAPSHAVARPSAVSAETQASPDSSKLIVIKVKKADYPRTAQTARLQGRVIVRLHISESGEVEKAEAVSGIPELSNSAVAAAKEWKFKPYIRNGRAVKVTTEVPFDFAFNDKVKEGKSQSEASAKFPSGGNLVYRVEPVYPILAQQRGISGTVVLAITIAVDGQVKNIRPVSGPRELIEAAVGAVQQWRYQPYVDAGKSFEADTTVTVNFKL